MSGRAWNDGMIYSDGVWSETMTIQTPRRRWVYEPERSDVHCASFFWSDGAAWARIPIARSLVGEHAFNLGAYLDAQADEALAVRALEQ